MKLFECCKQIQSGVGYQVTSKDNNLKSSVKFYKSYADINHDQLKSQNVSITKIIKSDYEKIAQQYSKKDKKWTDFSFPPNDQSLGEIENVSLSKWKRISEIVDNPILFSQSTVELESLDKNYPDKAFLASISALGQQSDRLKNIFGDQKFNSNGFYRINLRVKSQIQEVLIDDFIPVDNNDIPLFSKPNQGQIGHILIQKARAKVYGSYENLLKAQSTPRQILQEICFAPSQKLKAPNTLNCNETEKYWKSILDNVSKQRIIVVKTSFNQQIDWKKVNLLPNNYYSLIDCASLRNSQNKQQKIIQVKNSTGSLGQKQQGNKFDTAFWDKIQESQEKNKFLHAQNTRDGTFNLRYHDFLIYFSQVIVNYSQKSGSYIVEDLFFNLKNGIIHEVQVFNEGFYTFTANQNLQEKDDDWARTSILLIRKYCINAQYEYEFVDGTLNTDQPTALIKHHLTPGTYILYSKIHPTSQKSYFPNSPKLVIYSQYNIKIDAVSQKSHHDLLKKTFLSHGRNHKRQNFNDDLMWMSWKLFNQGGYGYVAFGNDKDSHDKFVITFNEEDFTSQGFKLKKPFKGKGSNQIIEVRPGEEMIILVTVGNSRNKNRKFPPKLGVNIHPFVDDSVKSSKSSRKLQGSKIQ